MAEMRPAIIFGEDPWTFQQDGCPAHKAYETQDFLRQNCPDVITVDPHWRNPIGEWPPNSPDLNPLDYAKAWKEITLKTLEKIVDNSPKRLKACVDANGGYFE
uniref:Tc1-like transposase DDE domain-containing protein n=1 Tax=Acrobeloides nanus TaxID=290746 RepID=A0A914ED33_9BILA